MKLTKLNEAVSGLLSSRDAFRKKPFSKKELRALVVERQRDHLTILKALGEIEGSVGKKVASMAVKDDKNYTLYNDYKKGLNNTQRLQESDEFLSTLLEANRRMAMVMSTLESEIDKLFQQERVGLLSMKMTHVVVAGVLYQSDCLGTYTKYMLNYVSSILNELEAVPTYCVQYLVNTTPEVCRIVNTVNDGTGAVDYKALIKKIQSSAADYALVNSETADSQVSTIEESLDLGTDEQVVVSSGILGLPFFRAIGEFTNAIRVSIVKYLRQEEAWMRAHVAALRDRTDGVDPNSDEFANQKRIIETYETAIDQIAKIRSKLD